MELDTLVLYKVSFTYCILGESIDAIRVVWAEDRAEAVDNVRSVILASPLTEHVSITAVDFIRR